MSLLVEPCIEFLNYFAVIFFNYVDQGSYIQATLLFFSLIIITILTVVIFILSINYIIVSITNYYKTHVKPPI